LFAVSRRPLYTRTPGHVCSPQNGEQCRVPVFTVGLLESIRKTGYLPLYAKTPGHGCGPQNGEQCRCPVLTVGLLGEKENRIFTAARNDSRARVRPPGWRAMLPPCPHRWTDMWERKQNIYRCKQGLQGTGAAPRMASNAAALSSLLDMWERKQNIYRCTQGLQSTGAARRLASNAAFLSSQLDCWKRGKGN
jgi:hypothetical protein